MITKVVEVTQTIQVTVDETKFNEEFMAGFREIITGFTTLDEHIKHLAQLKARGFIDWDDTFVEGYGPINKMGIKLEFEDGDESIVEG